MPVVDKFFCISLRTASKIVGWIDIIFSAISIILCALALFYVDDLIKSNYTEENRDAEKARIQIASIGMSMVSFFRTFQISLLLLLNLLKTILFVSYSEYCIPIRDYCFIRIPIEWRFAGLFNYDLFMCSNSQSIYMYFVLHTE